MCLIKMTFRNREAPNRDRLSTRMFYLLLLPVVYLTAQAQSIQPAEGLIEVNGIAYRLDGANLPAADAVCKDSDGEWPCGKAAWQALRTKLSEDSVHCQVLITIGSTANDFLPAECTVGETDSLNAWLVREGWALAGRADSAPFRSEETLAQTEGLGLWRGGFHPPEAWRGTPAQDCSVCSARHQSVIRTRNLRQQTEGAVESDAQN